jgi:hypothetical protein
MSQSIFSCIFKHNAADAGALEGLKATKRCPSLLGLFDLSFGVFCRWFLYGGIATGGATGKPFQA